ncbi:hypothetical protein [Nostoc sp. ChiSLP03a]|uniref:hypothetical protein n=1 Tax=Nostoc sp. ChiSLP03a TaxID=3075380 RepID=UPI002AD437A3|nr:hypothetical protein [Nostoc sp. ChiSLP03a]MDZ8215313.1 hypothetical protein [Nostoc sp. ChiSLP03a]
MPNSLSDRTSFCQSAEVGNFMRSGCKSRGKSWFSDVSIFAEKVYLMRYSMIQLSM